MKYASTVENQRIILWLTVILKNPSDTLGSARSHYLSFISFLSSLSAHLSLATFVLMAHSPAAMCTITHADHGSEKSFAGTLCLDKITHHS